MRVDHDRGARSVRRLPARPTVTAGKGWPTAPRSRHVGDRRSGGSARATIHPAWALEADLPRPPASSTSCFVFSPERVIVWWGSPTAPDFRCSGSSGTGVVELLESGYLDTPFLHDEEIDSLPRPARRSARRRRRARRDRPRAVRLGSGGGLGRRAARCGEKVAIPAVARLRHALERLVVHVDDAEALRVAVRPLEVVEQRPDEVALDRRRRRRSRGRPPREVRLRGKRWRSRIAHACRRAAGVGERGAVLGDVDRGRRRSRRCTRRAGRAGRPA